MNVLRTFDILAQLVEKYPKEDALAIKRKGKWEKFSTVEYKNLSDQVSFGLMASGFTKGDKIITISNNRPEWNFLDMGMSQIGVVHVPVYPNIGDEEYLHILTHSDAKMVIVSSKVFYENLKPLVKKVAAIKHFYTIDQVAGASNWEELLKLGAGNQVPDKLEEIKKSIDQDDLMSIIYTSGTTGRSKGVMLSHRNFITNVLGTTDILPVNDSARFLSFLPLCHVLERMVNYLVQNKGASVYYAESIDTIGDNLREINPQGFTAVPRVIEKLYDKLILKGKELTGVKRALFFWAVDLGLKYELNKANGWAYELQRAIADKLIYSKWRAALGGNLQVVISGGAALQERLARVFNCAGIPIMEGYGLTETSPVISVNQKKYPFMQFGTVGPVIDNVQVKIAEDGEILMKGPNLMLGYYKDKAMTDEVIDQDGWFHTGDIGVLLDHNILKITDRKKEIFKLSTGKYVAPQIVENRFKESSFIEQIMVVGENEKFAAAIICPTFHFLHAWCNRYGIKFRDNKDLIQKPKVIARYQQEVDKINKSLGNHQQIKKFELTCSDWTPESGELSPTLKVKRNFIKEKYKIKFDRLYGYTDESGHVGLPGEPESESDDKD
ncbi:MAG: long-chain fatty acid--CoA ligase [Bacteroidetes bacterium HGW-Bacteroidetes-16]|jgi:long-chain acyl-CoA synthetase|nr:MAG: long-chain fatty acid--CoA ligase [Bacteroidetes bacterium HGW-Bacteroidetes-16]